MKAIAPSRTMTDDGEAEIAPPKLDWTPSGRRKLIPEVAARPAPILWPKADQHAMVDLWAYVAAQIAKTKDHFRVLLAIDKSIRRDTGTTTDGNEVLSLWAGGMSTTNTSKAVSFFARAGLLIVEIGFSADENGKLRKSRTIRLAMPDPFPEGVSIDLPYKHLNRKQVGARSQVESMKSSWPRVSDAGARGQISSVDSSDRSQDDIEEHEASAGPLEAADVAKGCSPSSEVAQKNVDHVHDATARRPSGRAFVESPSLDFDSKEI